MAGLNKVILIGRVGKDPEVYTFEDGTKKISFSLATTESYRDKNGEWVDQTEWHNIVGFRYLAEKNIAKGDLVYIEGKIKTRKYTDRDSNERYITEIVGDKINILVRNQPGNRGYANTEQGGTQGAAPDPAPDQPANTGVEDDLPF
ncbi:MAG TPA: single-stranded DNA-binding protein [Bacteroidetes bacterium]|nr:single-stranded DNA-binding protein [Bacteroidota bacterium]